MNARFEPVTETKQALVALFIAAVRVGPVGLDTLLPRTISYNAANENEFANRWKYTRDDKPVRWFLREFSESRGSCAAFDALLVARPELLESNRDLVVRRVAREYAEAEAEGLTALGWQA